jgi:plasmid stabilization system protein ParE
MRVVLADRANADLEEIADWIGADDWDSAESFQRALRDKCETLGSNPKRYPPVLGAGARNLRKLSYRDYLIFYRVLESQVEIVRIVHGKRDWVPLLQVDQPGG